MKKERKSLSSVVGLIRCPKVPFLPFFFILENDFVYLMQFFYHKNYLVGHVLYSIFNTLSRPKIRIERSFKMLLIILISQLCFKSYSQQKLCFFSGPRSISEKSSDQKIDRLAGLVGRKGGICVNQVNFEKVGGKLKIGLGGLRDDMGGHGQWNICGRERQVQNGIIPWHKQGGEQSASPVSLLARRLRLKHTSPLP